MQRLLEGVREGARRAGVLLQLQGTALSENLFAEGVSLECLASVDEDFPAAEAFRPAS